jgi:aerobic-type carbon monoxide dehydrogenase small subunit (CoxS/CutS family)
MEEPVTFRLNGRSTTITVDSDRKLLWVLRTDLALTGTKYGCGEGFCGSCTVLVDDQAVRSCQTSLKEINGKSVTTIEGLALDGTLGLVQKKFVEHDALQCGYCTPGMIMNAVALLRNHPAGDLVNGMEDSLCRCGAHQRILRAIEAAAKEL